MNSTSSLTLAASPVSWGVDFPGAAGLRSPEGVLGDIAQLGLQALELGPLGYLPRDAATLAGLLDRHQLESVGTWLLAPLTDKHTAHWRDLAEDTVDFVANAGGGTLIVIDQVGSARGSTAGRLDAACATTQEEWSALLENVDWILGLADGRCSDVVFHPHAGTHVEFEHEIETFMSLTQDWPIGLCVDSGHCHYADIRAAELVDRHAHRVRHAHIKDINTDVLGRALEDKLDFWSAVQAGIFAPIGTGGVDIPSFCRSLWEAGVPHATLEQDKDPASRRSSLDDLRASVAYVQPIIDRLALTGMEAS
jgi:inosose dehydratase